MVIWPLWAIEHTATSKGYQLMVIKDYNPTNEKRLLSNQFSITLLFFNITCVERSIPKLKRA